MCFVFFFLGLEVLKCQKVLPSRPFLGHVFLREVDGSWAQGQQPDALPGGAFSMKNNSDLGSGPRFLDIS